MKSIFFVLLSLCLATSLFAKADSQTPSFDDDESILDLEQYEKLAIFSNGFSLSIGRAIPWQKLSLSYYRKMSDAGNHYLKLSVGGGDFLMKGNYDDLDYEIDSRSYSILASYRYYFTEFANFYVEPMGAISYWSGTTDAGGVDADSEQAHQMFTNKFTTAGFVIGGNFGILWQFRSGVFIDYSILRMSYSIPVYGNYENTNPGEEVTQSQIIGPHLWGSINLTVGYMF
jgi:opacity protein-like surface antigen